MAVITAPMGFVFTRSETKFTGISPLTDCMALYTVAFICVRKSPLADCEPVSASTPSTMRSILSISSADEELTTTPALPSCAQGYTDAVK